MTGGWRTPAAVALSAGLAAGNLLAGGPAPLAMPPGRQLVVVTAASYTTTYARFSAFDVTGGRRVRVFGPWLARVGYQGMARPGRKREGDGRTPSGTYGFGFFFGVRPSPGVRYPYRRAYSSDVWDDDPSSLRYNQWVDDRSGNPGTDPEPLHEVPTYDYAAVIAYNTVRTPGLGSAIFLHAGISAPTAGCVSLPAAELLKVLRWLNPARSPQITLTAR